MHWDDLEGNKLTIRRTRNQGRTGTPKNGKSRTIDLSPQLVRELQQHRKNDLTLCLKAGRKPKVVFNQGGDYFDYYKVRQTWLRMLKKAGLPRNKMHHLRHSCASLLIAAGIDPASVQHQLGHHSANFTLEVYAKAVKKDEAITGCLDPEEMQRQS